MTGKQHIIKSFIAAFLTVALVCVAFNDLHHLFAHEEDMHCEMHAGDHFHGFATEDCSACDMQQPLYLLHTAIYGKLVLEFPEVKKVHKPVFQLNAVTFHKAARAPPVV